MAESADFHIVDIHSHLLPGLDDGARTLETARRMCERYVTEGVSTVVATPHLCDPRFPVTPQDVRRGVQELSAECRSRNIQLNILPGGDVRLVPELLSRLERGDVLTLGDTGRYLLLELPTQTVPAIQDLVDELAERGVRVIVSHPERNMELWWKPGGLARLVEWGCLVQLTGDSLLGGFGRAARRSAERFLRAGLVHVVASDAHSLRSRAPSFREVRKRLDCLVGEEVTRELLATNPERITRGEPLSAGSVALGTESGRATTAAPEPT